MATVLNRLSAQLTGRPAGACSPYPLLTGFAGMLLVLDFAMFMIERNAPRSPERIYAARLIVWAASVLGLTGIHYLLRRNVVQARRYAWSWWNRVLKGLSDAGSAASLGNVDRL